MVSRLVRQAQDQGPCSLLAPPSSLHVAPSRNLTCGSTEPFSCHCVSLLPSSAFLSTFEGPGDSPGLTCAIQDDLPILMSLPSAKPFAVECNLLIGRRSGPTSCLPPSITDGIITVELTQPSHTGQRRNPELKFHLSDQPKVMDSFQELQSDEGTLLSGHCLFSVPISGSPAPTSLSDGFCAW